jgi:hypothetical protein
VPVADHEPVAERVARGHVLSDVDLDLGLERDGEHALGSGTADLVDAER